MRHGIQEFRDRGIWRSRRGRGIVLALPEPEPSEVARSLHIYVLERAKCTPIFGDTEILGFPPRMSFYGIREDKIDNELRAIVRDIEDSLDKLAMWWIDTHKVPQPETRGQSTVGVPFPYLVASLGPILPRNGSYYY